MFRAYKRYTDFRGRSGRKEYWLFVLLMIITELVAICLDMMLFGWSSEFTPLYWIACLVNLVPGLAVSFRRLHDINRSAWWLLIGLVPLIGAIVLIVFACIKGHPGENRFGPPDSDEPSPQPVGTVA